MRAALIRNFGGPEVIEILNIPKPTIEKNQVLVKNVAAGVNPVDTYVRSGTYAKLPQLPYVTGKDGSGIIEQVGSDVKNLKVGDRVWYGLELGATAEYSAVTKCFELPHDVSFEQGAALGVPYLTAYRAMFIQGNAKANDCILIHGASGGVGSAIAQLATWKGIRFAGTAGSEKGMEFVRRLGAENVYNHTEDGYIKAIKNDYPKGFDYVFEMAAHANLNNDLTLIAPHGKVAIIGNRAETTINARLLMQTEGSIYGVALGMSTSEQLIESGSNIVKFLKETKLRPHVCKEYKIEETCQSHIDIMNNKGSHGQIVVKI